MLRRTLTTTLALILLPGLAMAAGDFAPYGSSEPAKINYQPAKLAYEWSSTPDDAKANLQQLIDVLKVAHHGSRTSSTEEFLSAVRPGFAVISAGFENSYGHPHPTVVQRLREHHTAILRTDLDGMITIRTDGRKLEVETHRWRGEQ